MGSGNGQGMREREEMGTREWKWERHDGLGRHREGKWRRGIKEWK